MPKSCTQIAAKIGILNAQKEVIKIPKLAYKRYEMEMDPFCQSKTSLNFTK